MRKHLWILTVACILALPAGWAVADRVTLKDGRVITGSVSIEGASVLVKATFGTIRYDRSEVASIEFGATKEEIFASKLASADQSDPDALLSLAAWAEQQDLPREAKRLYQQIVTLAPNQPVARRKLGFVRIDEKWVTVAEGIQLARSKMEADRLDALLRDVLPALAAAADAKSAPLVQELLGEAQIRARRFSDAAETFKALKGKGFTPFEMRAAALVEILADNPDGLYVLKEKYPPAGELTGQRPLEPGPHSLASSLVLEAALRDRAKAHLARGQEAMRQAAKAPAEDAETAEAAFRQAERHFDRADALLPQLARSYRVEIARRRIAALRRRSDENAKRFDELLESLGRQKLSPAAYRNTVVRLIHYLDNVADDLDAVLAVAKPFSRELVFEVKWAELDRNRIEEMRRVLKKELDGNS